MSYYWFNRQGILQKAKEEYSKEKEYYLQNKEAIKEKAIETRHKKKNTKLESIRRKNIRNWFNIKRKH